MALLDCNFYSDSLGLSTSMKVILPQEIKSQIGLKGSSKKEKYPVLYLLHGMSDDESAWTRRTSIERYVAEMGIAVIMPRVDRSYYTDMKMGLKYWTFISEELPEIVKSFFPISDKREDTFVAGLSMGGYGALKLALSKPDKFAAAASLSGAINPVSLQRLKDVDSFRLKEFEWIFGDLKKFTNSKNDLNSLVKNIEKNNLPKPKLYQCCGSRDFLIEDNHIFRDSMEKTSFDFTYKEWAGKHEWGFWDTAIQKVLKWLPVKK